VIADKTKFGGYEIRSLLGGGRMVEVFLAEDTRLDRKVIIKFLNEEFIQDAHSGFIRWTPDERAITFMIHAAAE
jgi:serine/threonine protein kinase